MSKPEMSVLDKLRADALAAASPPKEEEEPPPVPDPPGPRTPPKKAPRGRPKKAPPAPPMDPKVELLLACARGGLAIAEAWNYLQLLDRIEE